jgi:hypothetical protein
MTSVIALEQWGNEMRNPLGLEITIRPKGRSPADEYLHVGQTWIEGRHNSDYLIELTNHTIFRMCAVVSVDGLSVCDGTPASFDSGGFLVEANNRITISGWLVNRQKAAKFEFGTKSNSYAASSGQPTDNVGVVGVAWFDEQLGVLAPKRPTYWAYSEPNDQMVPTQLVSRNAIGSITASGAPNSSGAIGTGFGPAVEFKTTAVDFKKRSNKPLLVQTIFYDSADALQKMGIRLRERNTYSSRVAFPGSEPTYCKPPQNGCKKIR